MLKRLCKLVPFLLITALVLGVISLSTAHAQEPREVDEESEKSQTVEVPVIVDGQKYSPSEFEATFIREDAVLYYIVDENTEAEGVLYAFTTKEGMVDYANSQGKELNLDQRLIKAPEPDATDNRHSFRAKNPSYQSQFYEHHKYNGYSFLLERGYYIPSLGSWWSNRISSVKTAKYSSWTCLYDWPNLSGSGICFWKNKKVRKLSKYGWNDRAESVVVYE